MPAWPGSEPEALQARLVLAISLDGRLAPAGGGAAQIGGPGDRRVLEEALAWADAALIGAGTLRAHGSTALIHHGDLLTARHRAGRPDQPLAVAVGRPASLDPGLPFFRQPLRRWLLQPTCQQTGTGARNTGQRHGGQSNGGQHNAWQDGGCGLPPPAGYERHWCCSSWPEALAVLAEAGLRRLAVLGGAQIAAALLAQGLIDDLQLTLCPRLLGGEHLWLPAASGLPGAGQAGWSLQEQRGLAGGELLLRYRRPPIDPI